MNVSPRSSADRALVSYTRSHRFDPDRGDKVQAETAPRQDPSMLKMIVMLVALCLCGCTVEFDVAKTPRRDPCTQHVETKTFYPVPPYCPNPPVPEPVH